MVSSLAAYITSPSEEVLSLKFYKYVEYAKSYTVVKKILKSDKNWESYELLKIQKKNQIFFFFFFFFFFCLFWLGLRSRRVRGFRLRSGAGDCGRVRSGVKGHCGRLRSGVKGHCGRLRSFGVKGHCGRAAFGAFGAFGCVRECIREPAARKSGRWNLLQGVSS